jgi:NAD(P)-dependent dehydrogenase (short-subunit alcohol dehydrogenase family)
MGRALVQVLRQDGWRVFAAARDTSRIPDGVYRRYRFDASDHGTIKAIAIDLAHETEGLNIWAYAAGQLRADLLHKMTPAHWNDVLHSNLNGAFLTATQTIHLVREGGQVAFIGAYVDHLHLPKMGAYAAAKAGLEAFVAVLQKENRKLNVTLVKPGAVATPFWENAPFKIPAEAKSPEVFAAALLAQYKQEERGTLAL